MSRNILVLVCLCFASLAFGGDELDTVLSKHTQAMGGEAKLKQVQSMKLTGIIDFNGYEHPFEWVKSSDGRYRWQAEGMTRYGTSLEMGKFLIVGCDGDKGWVHIGTQDPAINDDLPPPRTAYLKAESAPFGSLVAPLSEGQSREFGGKIDLDGETVLHIRMNMGGGFVENWYLHPETYLPVQMSADMPGGQGRVRQRVWYFDDYRAVKGLQIPHYIEREDNQFVRTHLVEKVEFNPDLSGVVFTKPTN